jgi:hypothetical protein
MRHSMRRLSILLKLLNYAGIDVRVAEGDLRMFVSFGPDAEKQPAAGQTTS